MSNYILSDNFRHYRYNTSCFVLKLKTYCCVIVKQLCNPSRFLLSSADCETSRHSSAQPLTPRLMLQLWVTMKTESPRTRGLVSLQELGSFSFGSPFKIWSKFSEINSDT